APQFAYQNTREIRAEMARLMPLYSGIDKLERAGDQIQWGGPQLGATTFRTSDGKAHLQVVPLPSTELPPGRFMLTSRRGKQFNSMTYGSNDPLTGAERAAVVIDEHDQRELGVRPGQTVRVASDHGELVAVVRTGPCRRRHVQAFWPECNVLLARKYDPVSGEPDYNTSVTIEPAPARAPHAPPP
ncbi:MAG TPA: molybdopterin dinucleotide binding domain-containing protein, partial [Polyangiaceae bacterium]